MADSPETVSEGQVDATSTPDAVTEDSSNDVPNPEIDTDELRAAVDAAGQEAALRADITALKRATGHIPGLQKRLDSLQTAIDEIGSLKQSVARFDALLDALPEGLISDRALADLRPTNNTTADELRKQIAALEAKVNGEGQQQDEADVDAAQLAYIAQANAATASVNAYAASKKFDLAGDDPIWEKALAAHPNDLTLAALDVMKYVDGEIARRARIAEKADAAEGSTDSGRNSRDKELTWEAMGRMTTAELLKIPREVREAAMAKAGQSA